jgi:disulfide bond formation protein DsbB
MEEYHERLKLIAYGKYYGRTAFLVLVGVEILNALTDVASRNHQLVQVIVMGAAALIGLFWYSDELGHRDSMRRISDSVAQFTEMQRAYEKRSYEKWDTTYIRHHYDRMYSLYPVVAFSKYEPWLWTGTIICTAMFLIFLRLRYE